MRRVGEVEMEDRAGGEVKMDERADGRGGDG